MGEVRALGWSWESSLWAFDSAQGPVPVVGGPNGYYAHRVREGIRIADLQRAQLRRPGIDGAARVDRRAVYASIKHGTQANQDLSDYRRGVVRSIVTGAGTFQKH